MPRRLAQKLVLSLTVIVVIVAAVSGLVHVKTEERQLLQNMILGADQLSKAITSATWHAMLTDHRGDAYQVMQTIAEKQGIERIRMFNRAGQVMFSTHPGDSNTQVEKDAATCAVCHASGSPKLHPDVRSRVRIYRDAGGERGLAMVTPIYNEPSCSQAACHAHPAELKVLGVLDVALSLQPVDREIAAVQIRVALVTAIQIILIAVFIYFFTRRFITVPIGKLVEGTKAVSAMDLDKPFEIIDSSLELGELSRSFNAMRERLRGAMYELNQFTQDLESKVERRTAQLKVVHQKLMKNDRLASLGQLAASVAHEINNPVSGVLNLSMLMQRIMTDEGVPANRVQDFRRYLSQVVGETSRVGRIVSDLLSFSRRSRPQRSPEDLNRIIRTTVSLASHKLKLNNVEMHLDLQEDLPSVLCDASQMQQVILNLVLNAAESTHAKDGGRVAVRTRAHGGSQTLLLEVEDNGEGIPRENLTRIFDPFFTTKPEGKGVGLGLAVLYGIVQAHGGDVDVTSEPGSGTTFTVTLPLAQADTAATA
ncbi:MAG TPA: ATP-binding protein [Bryobacteraceae bacterium]|nr:ATP-binding protein [Bryobacteraceae bacterium]